jgi:aerobic C4-dicarboxylate transport protein
MTLKRVIHHLYFWVLIAIVLGAAIGFFSPDVGENLKPLGDAFIALITMVIGPVIFCTVVLGIANAGDMKKVGRVGGKALIYFEIVSTFALAIGLLVANVLKPGENFHADAASLDVGAIAGYAEKAKEQNIIEFLFHLIPKTFFDAFTGSGNLLQILVLALLFGWSLNHLKSKSETLLKAIEQLSQVLFHFVGLIMKLAPLGAGGAMAFTVGKYGIGSLAPLAFFMFCFYLSCLLFIFIVLGAIASLCGFNIFRFIYYLRDEVLTVLGTSSSESVLVPLMQKMENLGCSKSVVGLVVPSGYSFNLDGTNIYLTMAALFVAQALHINLSLSEQLSLLLIAVLTSKGASGVTGAGFITLAATLAVVPKVPVAGLTLILGVDRFMSEARAITNMIGNGVATVVIAKWEKELDSAKLREELRELTKN